MDHPLAALRTSTSRNHFTTYPHFILRGWLETLNGGPWYFAWMILLAAIALVGLSAWASQVQGGMIVTNMTDHVSWGLYIANFTFLVGLAAGGVMMVIPAYLYHDHKMHDVVIVGEMLAIAAILMCLLFVTVDLGRPDRFWHMIPGLGRFNFPMSMLTWDVIVLNGYLIINLHVVGYLLYCRFLGRAPKAGFYIPVVFLSIVWAISIHTVTAFLYCGLGSRPFWNSALLAPRFLASAFVAGPAFIVVTLHALRRLTDLPIAMDAIRTLLRIIRVTLLINFLMVVSELFTELYSGSAHTASAHYLFFGLHGKHALVPWIWSAIGMNLFAGCLLLTPRWMEKTWAGILACILCFVGAWIEKGMGLIVPGFIPSTLHEMVEYSPSLAEWKVSAGIWAFGLLAYTAMLKASVPILRGRLFEGAPR